MTENKSKILDELIETEMKRCQLENQLKSANELLRLIYLDPLNKSHMWALTTQIQMYLEKYCPDAKVRKRKS